MDEAFSAALLLVFDDSIECFLYCPPVMAVSLVTEIVVWHGVQHFVLNIIPDHPLSNKLDGAISTLIFVTADFQLGTVAAKDSNW